MASPNDASILVITDFAQVSSKFETHFEPLSWVCNNTTIICINQNTTLRTVEFVQVPIYQVRAIGILLIPFYAFIELWRNDYDAIVSFSLFPYGIISLLLGKLFKIPIHHGIIGIDLDVHAQSWYKIIPIKMFHLYDTISVTGTFHRNQLIRYGLDENSIFILPNSIDTNLYKPCGAVDKIYDFCWAGRFSPEKRPLLFIEALVKMAKSDQEFKAVICGDGKMKNSIEKRIATHGLNDKIDLTGWVENPSEYYQKSRIFVLTSEREGLSTSLLEAMACGLPCVAPNVGDVQDVVRHRENGILLDDLDKTKLARQLIRLKNSKHLINKMGNNATKVRERYSKQKSAVVWSNIMVELLGDKSYSVDDYY